MTIWVLVLAVALLWVMLRWQRTQQKLRQLKQDFQQMNREYTLLQQTLARREQRLDVLFASVTDAVLRVDKSGRVLGGNAQAKALFQWQYFAPLPQAMLLFYRNHAWLKAYQEALHTLPKQVELPEIRLRKRVLKPRLVPLGEHQALLLCIDVTAYVSLQRQQKTMLANLMHDLKTPLTSLLGYARSIERFIDNRELCQEAAAVIASEAKHINDLMNTMLTLEQIEHQHAGAANSCDLLLVWQQVWEALQPHVLEKGIRLQGEIADSCMIQMRVEDCTRIVMNIAENAVKFSPPEGLITCTLEVEEDAIVMTIMDEGCGIAPQHIAHVTERFYRADDARIRAQGHGLGLAIVQEILERDAGVLLLENRENSTGLSVSMTFKKARDALV